MKSTESLTDYTTRLKAHNHIRDDYDTIETYYLDHEYYWFEYYAIGTYPTDPTFHLGWHLANYYID